MQKLIVIIVLLWGHLSLVAQKYDHIWTFGGSNNLVLDFNYENDSIYGVNLGMSFGLANTSFCDTAGNLMCYTNGIYIADSSNQLMLNGDSLNPGVVAQGWRSSGYPVIDGVLGVPIPQNDSLYNLFHISWNDALTYTNRLYYTTFNLNLNNGKGGVIAKNKIILEDTIALELEAIKHDNGNDWWILIPEENNTAFYRFLLTKDSIYGPFYQIIGNTKPQGYFSQAAFSPDGRKYARYDAHNDLNLFDFDRCTGLLSNYQHIIIQDTADASTNASVTGLAFSPNSRYLYINSAGLFVYQFDVLASNIFASMDTVAIYDGYSIGIQESAFFLAQLAPNGKIYFNCTGTVDVLHVIHSPDSAGVACNFAQRGVQLPFTISPSLPNFPHFRTPALSIPCDTVMSGIVIEEVKENLAKVYPNPVNNYIIVEWDVNYDKKGELIIYNTLGQVVQQTTLNTREGQQEVNLPQLPSGMYICKLFFDKKPIHEEKIIIEQP